MILVKKMAFFYFLFLGKNDLEMQCNFLQWTDKNETNLADENMHFR